MKHFIAEYKAILFGVVVFAVLYAGIMPALAGNIDSAALLAGISAVSPAISGDGTRIILPESGSSGHDVVIYATSNEQTVGTDGLIHAPLTDTEVKIMYKVVNKNDPEDSAIDNYSEASVIIPGKYKEESGDNAKPEVIPALREWKGRQGNLVLSDTSRIIISNESFRETAGQIKYYFKEMLDFDISVAAGEPENGDIYINATEKAELGSEGYFIDIGNFVNIECLTNKGALYAGTTLTQILYGSGGGRSLPKGIIRDYPQYEVRSVMIDVGRIYVPLSQIKEITRYAAYFKLNELHLHVSEMFG